MAAASARCTPIHSLPLMGWGTAPLNVKSSVSSVSAPSKSCASMRFRTCSVTSCTFIGCLLMGLGFAYTVPQERQMNVRTSVKYASSAEIALLLFDLVNLIEQGPEAPARGNLPRFNQSPPRFLAWQQWRQPDADTCGQMMRGDLIGARECVGQILHRQRRLTALPGDAAQVSLQPRDALRDLQLLRQL